MKTLGAFGLLASAFILVDVFGNVDANHLYHSEDAAPVIEFLAENEDDPAAPSFVFGASNGGRVLEFYSPGCPHVRTPVVSDFLRLLVSDSGEHLFRSWDSVANFAITTCLSLARSDLYPTTLVLILQSESTAFRVKSILPCATNLTLRVFHAYSTWNLE